MMKIRTQFNDLYLHTLYKFEREIPKFQKFFLCYYHVYRLKEKGQFILFKHKEVQSENVSEKQNAANID